jgi:enoyl-CoA hydratase/carnithine racemase
VPYQILAVQREDNVMLVSMIDPANDIEKMGRLSDELTDLCDDIVLDEEIRVIIATISGEKPFSVGTNLLKPISSCYEEHQKKVLSVTEPISKLNQPVIVVLKGDAIGEALELALACDIRIASETSHFGLPQIKAGLIPWDGGTQRLARLVGRGKALEMILTGETIDAQEAYRVGLIHRVVPLKELMEVAMNMAWEMASKGPIALRYAKEAIHKGIDMTLEQGLRLEADLYLLIHTSKDRTEGIQAFREKRTPQFEGK